MANSPQIVVFGATGYTGQLVAEALVRRGCQPVLAGRSQSKLTALAERLGGLQTRVADVADSASVSALVGRDDVLVSTVGPFARWGRPALEAAIQAGAHYVDTTGETPFIRTVFDEYYSERARRAGSTLLPAFGYDYVPGTLAAALALRAAGEGAAQVDVGYFVTGSVRRAFSSGTNATAAAGLLSPAVIRRAGQTTEVRVAQRVRTFAINGRRRSAFLTGGSESLTLPRLAPQLQDIGVYNGWMPALSRPTQALSAIIAAVRRIPGMDATLTRFAASRQGSQGGPDAETRSASRSYFVAVVRDSAGRELAQAHVEGPSVYDLTAELVAWAAEEAAAGALREAGAVGPIEAFGLAGFVEGCEALGLFQITNPVPGARL